MNKDKKIRVTFPSYTGDENRMMTIEELRNDSEGCLLIDPMTDKAVTIDEIETIDLREVVVMPPIAGG